MERRLFEASLSGSVPSLEALMKEDELILDRVSLTWMGETPLHIAALRGHSDLTRELLNRKPKLATELDSFGRSPLHLASAEGHTEIVRELLRVNAADVCYIRDQDGRIPLHLAAMKGRHEVIRHLVQACPESTRVKVDQGETILHLCVKHSRLKALMSVVELLSDDMEFVNSKDNNGNTILHLAAILKQEETIKFLLSKTGVIEKANSTNGNGFTALDVLELCPRDLKSMEIRDIMLEAGVRRARELQADFPPASVLNLPTNTGTRTSSQNISQTRCGAWGSKALVCMEKLWYDNKGLEQARGNLMVVATVTATLAFQTVVNPPGGVWQDPDDGKHEPGSSIIATLYPKPFNQFLTSNTVCLIASLGILLLLSSGFPLHNKFIMWLLVVTMCITVLTITVTYIFSMDLILPGDPREDAKNLITGSVLAWFGLCLFVGLLQTLRLLSWLILKLQKFVRLCRGKRRPMNNNAASV